MVIKRILTIYCFMIGFSIVMTAQDRSNSPQLGKNSIKEIIASMTLEEKANFVIGTARAFSLPPEPAPGMIRRPKPDFKKLVEEMTNAESKGQEGAVTVFSQGKVKGAGGEGCGIERLNIPVLIYADGPAGLRIDPIRPGDSNKYYCTAYPCGTLLASSWDTQLVETVTKALGNEVKEFGVDILLAPAMNIHRNPLCGRNFEYYSEDPLLAGKIASAYIHGIQSNEVGTSLKHFAINNQETYRNGVDVKVSQRAMREIYLKGFEIAVKEGHPWTVMSSYNKINGVLASENKWLLTDVLRKDWGFNGFVMTDWWAEENGARQIAAGNDLMMPGSQHQVDEIINGVKLGNLDEKLLNRSIENILNVMLKTSSFNRYNYSNKPDMNRHAAIVRETASQGMVLLENKNMALPIEKKIKKIAAFGQATYDTYVGGTGSGNVNRKYKISLNEGLKNAGYTLDPQVVQSYQNYLRAEKAKQPAENFWVIPVIPEMTLQKVNVIHSAKDADIAILTFGRMAGEGEDRKLEKGDYYLNDVEMNNLKLVCDAFHAQGKKVIVVLNAGGVIDMAGWKNMPDAILHTWLAGQEAGNSISDVLSGKVNPSGKLPMTITVKYEDNPSEKNFPQSDNNPAKVRYEEDIFVGYRYFDSSEVKPLYPFGYGLSYTTFAYSNMKVTSIDDGKTFEITVNVKNIGKVAGREVVQLYISAPKGNLKKPVKELKAFGKTILLQPGQSETLTMQITKEDLASYDEGQSKWVVDAGKYTVRAASSSADVRLNSYIDVK